MRDTAQGSGAHGQAGSPGQNRAEGRVDTAGDLKEWEGRRGCELRSQCGLCPGPRVSAWGPGSEAGAGSTRVYLPWRFASYCSPARGLLAALTALLEMQPQNLCACLSETILGNRKQTSCVFCIALPQCAQVEAGPWGPRWAQLGAVPWLPWPSALGPVPSGPWEAVRWLTSCFPHRHSTWVHRGCCLLWTGTPGGSTVRSQHAKAPGEGTCCRGPSRHSPAPRRAMGQRDLISSSCHPTLQLVGGVLGAPHAAAIRALLGVPDTPGPG